MARGIYGVVYLGMRMVKNPDGSFSRDRDDSLRQIVIKIIKSCKSTQHERDACHLVKEKRLEGFSTIIDHGVVERKHQLELNLDKSFNEFIVLEKHGVCLKDFADDAQI